MMSPFRLAEFAIALLGLFFMSGTLTSILTPEGSATAPLVQVIGGVLGLFSVFILLSMRNSIPQIFTLYWLALLPVALAVLSLAWTEDVSLTIRRGGSLGLTSTFALWLALRFTPSQLFRLVVLMAVSIIIVNFVVIQVLPARGIHQTYDLINAHHAGSWRGLFGHKNDFGRLIAFSMSVLVMAFVFSVGGRYLRWLMLPVAAIAVLMIANSSSSQASLLAATVPTAVALLLLMRKLSPSSRTIVLIAIVPVAVIGVLSAQLLFEYVLGLLGRDATLTGRTTIWEGVLLSLDHNLILGGGYGAGWQVVGPRLAALTGIEVGHAHNGFLDLAVDIGIMGLGVTLTFMFYLSGMAFSNLMRGVRPEIAVLALSTLTFSFIGNVAGSFLLLHNSLYWVLLIATFAQLRDAAVLGPSVDHTVRDHSAAAVRQTWTTQ
jgi:O-antigen ligase